MAYYLPARRVGVDSLAQDRETEWAICAIVQIRWVGDATAFDSTELQLTYLNGVPRMG